MPLLYLLQDLEEAEVEEATCLCEEEEGRAWLLDYVRHTTALRSHVLCCRAPARPLPPLSPEVRRHLGACAPSYAGPQLARAEGAPDELTPEDVDAFGLQGCAYMRGVSESLEWARPLAASASISP